MQRWAPQLLLLGHEMSVRRQTARYFHAGPATHGPDVGALKASRSTLMHGLLAGQTKGRTKDADADAALGPYATRRLLAWCTCSPNSVASRSHVCAWGRSVRPGWWASASSQACARTRAPLGAAKPWMEKAAEVGLSSVRAALVILICPAVQTTVAS